MKQQTETGMRNRNENSKTKTEMRNTETESQTEFTPFAGLRLRVPLQWVPIQLISLRWYKNGSGINFSNCKQNVVQSLQGLFCKLQNGFQKAKKPNHNRV